MSFLLPFEVQTKNGWKQAGELKEEDVILCFEQEHGLVYRQIRQCLIYDSNFTFTEFSNGPFRLSICDGVPLSPFLFQSMPCPSESVLSLKCTEEERPDGAYNPDPNLVYTSSDVVDLDGLQLEAAARGVHAVVEHTETFKICLREMPFAPVGIADKHGRKAISLSCYEDKPTHMLVRLAALEDCYKTFALIL